MYVCDGWKSSLAERIEDIILRSKDMILTVKKVENDEINIFTRENMENTPLKCT